jgi:hypothetical protein
MLRSGKEILGNKPLPFKTLTKQQISAELIARVGVETAQGTVNYYSHFVPCGTESGISNNFGHGAYYRFHIQGKIYKKENEGGIDDYIQEREQLPSYIVPLFEGGNHEVLAYTGTLITSVALISGQNESVVMNSLD